MQVHLHLVHSTVCRRLVLFLVSRFPKFVWRCLGVFLLCIGHVYAQDMLLGMTSNGGPDGKGTVFSIKSTGTDYNLVSSFADWGRNPNSNLVLGADGSFYGTTTNGGMYNQGTIYKLSPSGLITLVKSFNLPVDGGYPYGSLALAPDGSLYGTASGGGINNGGVIYKVSTAGVYSIVRSLAVNVDGGHPKGRLVFANDGNFYGTTYDGGTNGVGTIFRLSLSGSYSVIRHLNKATDGGNMYGSLVQATDGNLYGMCYWGGTYNFGTIFRTTLTGGYSVLKHLNVASGSYPKGSLIQALDGKLYGMISSGGTNGNGTIFSITTGGVFAILRNLAAGTDGAYPNGDLIQHTDTYLYGLLPSGGAKGGGTAFKISTGKAFSVLRAFTPATDGSQAQGGFVKGADGAFYAANSEAGPGEAGTVYKLTPAGLFTFLNSFSGSINGNEPLGNLVQGSDFAYYGTTSAGGTYANGTIFRICGGKKTILKSFNRSADGGVPKGGLVQGPDGLFYGMTSAGGTYGYGTIYKISSAGAFNVVRHLQAAKDGAYPAGALILAKDGAFYGMTNSGGTGNAGTLFKFSASIPFTVIRHFATSTDGGYPEGTLVQHTDGSIYGITTYNARIFKLAASGAFSIIKTLNGTTEGSTPIGGLTVGGDGNLYGTTSLGGSYGKGTVFKVTTGGQYSIVRHLNTTTDGQNPKGSLVLGSSKALFGLTSTGGAAKGGTLFTIGTDGVFKVLKSFDPVKEGSSAFGGLIVNKGLVLVANPQSVSTTEELAKAITLTGSGATTLTYNIIGQPKNGKLSGTAPAITYTPTTNFSGRDSFYFNVSVGCQSSAPAKVLITVSAVNDAPVLAPIGAKTIVKSTALKFVASASDPDAGQTKTFTLITPPAGATINATTGLFTYTPAATGTFNIKVRVTDNGSPVLYDEEIVPVTVTASLVAGAAAPSEEAVEKTVKASLYPNPARDRVVITFSGDVQPRDLKVINVAGEQMRGVQQRTISGTSVVLDVSRLTAGIYFVKAQSGERSDIYQFVKQ